MNIPFSDLKQFLVPLDSTISILLFLCNQYHEICFFNFSVQFLYNIVTNVTETARISVYIDSVYPVQRIWKNLHKEGNFDSYISVSFIYFSTKSHYLGYS